MEAFDFTAFLKHGGLGKRLISLRAKSPIFVQGGTSDSIFYVQEGRAKLCAVSATGKEATITLLSAGDFVGEEALISRPGPRTTTCAAISACVVLRIDREEMIRVMRDEQGFSHHFLACLLARSIRTQADLIDLFFLSSEIRLAKALLSLSEAQAHGDHDVLIAKITQTDLAEIVGTTRSRISFFMNRLRALGLIEYGKRIRVHRALLSIVVEGEGRVPSEHISRKGSKRASSARYLDPGPCTTPREQDHTMYPAN